MPITPLTLFGPGGFPTNPYTRGPGFRLDNVERGELMPDYGYNQPYTIPDLGFEPMPFEPDGGPGRSLYFTDGSPSNTNNVGDIYKSGAVLQGSLQPSNFQPSPTSFGIGGFEQPYQQQNMGSLGSNKPTANVLF
jgi:hypothetical protein